MQSKWRLSTKLAGSTFLALLLLCAPGSARAGDSLYGRITAVKAPDLITLDYGAGSYDIRLAGIDVPQDRASANEAMQFVSRMLLNKNARLRFDGRTPDGEMVGRILTDDPDFGIKDIGVEMVRSGLALRETNYRGYVYGEMAAAEAEARQAQRGFWNLSPFR